ncbi:hypothetical protein IJH02_01680 [Candidatus Saccharibacteria bacterium]|nr:hypothetical protein [Candidatus Saccharibacteria bacterium]
MKKTRGIIWGIAVLALGVIFGGNALGIWNIDIFFKGWWTLFLIVPSTIGLITEKEKLSNLMVLGVGICLLLAAQDVFSWETAGKTILALFLVVLGLGIIFKTIFHNKFKKAIKDEVKKSEKAGDEPRSHLAIFSGENVSYDKEELKNVKLCAVFGGIELDLRNAIIKDAAVIKAFSLFGGIDILLPENVILKTSSGFIFGGITDDRKNADKKSTAKNNKSAKSTNPTIYLDASGGFGGVEVK